MNRSDSAPLRELTLCVQPRGRMLMLPVAISPLSSACEPSIMKTSSSQMAMARQGRPRLEHRQHRAAVGLLVFPDGLLTHAGQAVAPWDFAHLQRARAWRITDFARRLDAAGDHGQHRRAVAAADVVHASVGTVAHVP